MSGLRDKLPLVTDITRVQAQPLGALASRAADIPQSMAYGQPR